MVLYLVQLPPHFDRVSEKAMDGSNVMGQKGSFLATLGYFGAFLAITSRAYVVPSVCESQWGAGKK